MDAYFMAALTPKEAYDMSYSNPKLRPKLERVIATSAEFSYWYARHVLKRKPFPAGEPAIATSAEYSYYYAIDVLQRRFPAGEPALATDACMAYDYNQRFGTSI